MDAHALLTSQGWRGLGHSLHPTSDTTGLSRPLLVSQKVNNLGVGKKQHRTSDMWWMNAFDNSLKGLDTSKEGKVVQTLTNGGLDMVAKGGAKFVGDGGLYACFVRGECLSGTITPEDWTEEPLSKKQRREEKVTHETKEERRARKAAKRAMRAHESTVEESPRRAEAEVESIKSVKTKGERKECRRQNKLEGSMQENAPQDFSGKAKKKKRRKDRF